VVVAKAIKHARHAEAVAKTWRHLAIKRLVNIFLISYN
jgi:hypothetical protein